MSGHGRKGSRPKKGKSPQKSQQQTTKVMRLICPTYPDTYGPNALIPSDYTRVGLVKALKGYTTTGQDQCFSWRVSSDVPSISQVAVTDAMGAINVRLQNMPGYGDLATVFDTYRLKAVSVIFAPQNGVQQVSGSALAPRLYTTLDYDDSTAVARTSLQQYSSTVVTPPGLGVIRTLIPRYAKAVYGNAAFTSYGQGDPSDWIDIASPAVEFYGVKYVIEGGAMNQTVLQTYSVNVTAFWQFKSSR